MSDQESSGEIRLYTDLTAFHDGDPHVNVVGGEVRIWPAGLGSIYLSVSVEHWRILAAEVEAAIAESESADTPGGAA